MAKDRFIFLISFACLGLLAAFLFRSPDKQELTPLEKEVMVEEQITNKVVEVMTAQKPLKAGKELSSNDFAWAEIDRADLNPSMIIKDPKVDEWITRAVITSEIAQGDNIGHDNLRLRKKMGEEGGIKLAPGKVGIVHTLLSRPLIAKFIQPGDFVDIIFTSDADSSFGTISLSLLNRVRVLAIEDYDSVEVMLEMSLRDAEVFSYAEKIGSISLAITHDDSQGGEYDHLKEVLLKSRSSQDFNSMLMTHVIHSLFPTVDVKVIASKKGYIVSGKVSDPQIAEKIREILLKMDYEGLKTLVDLMEVEPQQVMICVKVLEVSRAAMCTLGVDWKALYENAGSAVALGSVFPAPALGAPHYFVEANKILAGNFTISGLIDLLQENGYVKVMAEPNLTTVSGKTAHFFAGGEFPILIPQGGNLVGTVTVEYREFGVILDFTPHVGLNGLITLHVAPEISAIDKNNSVVLNGFDIPSLVVRRAETTVKLWPGQCYAIAGMLQYDKFSKTDRIYGLSRIPIIGALFQSKKFIEKETELVIFITPYLVYSDGTTGEFDTSCYNECNCNQDGYYQ